MSYTIEARARAVVDRGDRDAQRQALALLRQCERLAELAYTKDLRTSPTWDYPPKEQ